MSKSAITIHREALKKPGIELCNIYELNDVARAPHRDDHYMFIIQQKGTFLWELDFQQIKLTGAAICYVAPGQVHHYLQQKDCVGWFVFIETALIPTMYRDIFHTHLNSRQFALKQKDNELFSFLPVMEKLLENNTSPFQDNIIESLTSSLAGLVATTILSTQSVIGLAGGQKYKTVTHFKQLVQKLYRTKKQVKDYAALLHITPLYLNEISKQITGFAASYWIHQAIILEARRLLYYSDLDIKQIAFDLGYEDHTYFSRFFKTHTGTTASDFRQRKP